MEQNTSRIKSNYLLLVIKHSFYLQSHSQIRSVIICASKQIFPGIFNHYLMDSLWNLHFYPVGTALELIDEPEHLSWPRILLWREMLPFELIPLLNFSELVKRSHRRGENRITEGYNLHPLWAFPHSWAELQCLWIPPGCKLIICWCTSMQLQRLLFAPEAGWGYHVCSARLRPPKKSSDEELPKVFQQKEQNKYHSL